MSYLINKKSSKALSIFSLSLALAAPLTPTAMAASKPQAVSQQQQSQQVAIQITKTGSQQPSEAAMFLGKTVTVNSTNGKVASFSLHVDGSKNKMTQGQDMTKMISAMSINGVSGQQANVNQDHSQFDFVFPATAYKAGKGTLTVNLSVMGHQMKESCDLALPSLTTPAQKQAKKYTVKHSAYLYNKNGKRVTKKVLKAGSQIKAIGTKVIKGSTYCQLSKNRFVKASNVLGTKRQLKHNAYIYYRNGKHGQLLKKHRQVTTYGSVIKLHGKHFYHISANRFVKSANF